MLDNLTHAVLSDMMNDPSYNVSTRFNLDAKRQDDLRVSHEKLDEERISHLREIADIRELHAKEIRDVDMVNAKSSADAIALAIQTLNGVTITNAENLRNSLNSTATTMAKTTTDLAQKIADDQRVRDENINKRIIVLEQSSYVGMGKDKVTDPMMDKLLGKLDSLVESRAENKGKGLGYGAVLTIALGALALGSFIMEVISKMTL
jgi:hypothetical protein